MYNYFLHQFTISEDHSKTTSYRPINPAPGQCFNGLDLCYYYYLQLATFVAEHNNPKFVQFSKTFEIEFDKVKY